MSINEINISWIAFIKLVKCLFVKVHPVIRSIGWRQFVNYEIRILMKLFDNEYFIWQNVSAYNYLRLVTFFKVAQLCGPINEDALQGYNPLD